MRRWLNVAALLAVIAAFALIVARNLPRQERDTLRNVSHDRRARAIPAAGVIERIVQETRP